MLGVGGRGREVASRSCIKSGQRTKDVRVRRQPEAESRDREIGKWGKQVERPQEAAKASERVQGKGEGKRANERKQHERGVGSEATSYVTSFVYPRFRLVRISISCWRMSSVCFWTGLENGVVFFLAGAHETRKNSGVGIQGDTGVDREKGERRQSSGQEG